MDFIWYNVYGSAVGKDKWRYQKRKVQEKQEEKKNGSRGEWGRMWTIHTISYH